MQETVYIKMKKHVSMASLEQIELQDITYISTSSLKKNTLKSLPIYQVRKEDNDVVVIDYFIIVKHLNKRFPNMQFQLIGSPHTIVKVDVKEQKGSLVLVAIVWLLLFIGTAMTIMNFHYDVSMQEVQQKLHYIITGEGEEFPLYIQIPYSFGLGLGMLLFFNHWFHKRFTDEPSPLEVELHNYQNSLDEYVIDYENILKDD